jgi:hypothetical protein
MDNVTNDVNVTEVKKVTEVSESTNVEEITNDFKLKSSLKPKKVRLKNGKKMDANKLKCFSKLSETLVSIKSDIEKKTEINNTQIDNKVSENTCLINNNESYYSIKKEDALLILELLKIINKRGGFLLEEYESVNVLYNKFK